MSEVIHRHVTFWPTSETSCSIQTHTGEQAKIVSRLDTARKIAYSVAGKPLEVWNVDYALPWVRRELPKLVPEAVEVYGGDWTDWWAKEATLGKVTQTTLDFPRKTEGPQPMSKEAGL